MVMCSVAVGYFIFTPYCLVTGVARMFIAFTAHANCVAANGWGRCAGVEWHH